MTRGERALPEREFESRYRTEAQDHEGGQGRRRRFRARRARRCRGSFHTRSRHNTTTVDIPVDKGSGGKYRHGRRRADTYVVGRKMFSLCSTVRQQSIKQFLLQESYARYHKIVREPWIGQIVSVMFLIPAFASTNLPCLDASTVACPVGNGFPLSRPRENVH